MNAPAEAAVFKQHLIDPEIYIRCNTCEATCPVEAITHDSRNYVVDPEKCNFCMDCISPCPTGSIDNWRLVPRARAYTLEAQLGWDDLPPELTEAEMAEAGVSAADVEAAEAEAGSATSADLETSAAANQQTGLEAAIETSRFSATVPPWSA